MAKPFDELIKSPLSPSDNQWPVRDAPDFNSMMAATRVQMLLAAGNHASPEDYLIEEYGETPEVAAQIVANCRAESDLG